MKKNSIILTIYFASLEMISCNNHWKNANYNQTMLQKRAYNTEKNISDTLRSDIQVEYTISKEYPSVKSSVWKQVFNKQQNEKEISNINQNETFWIRVSDDESRKRNIYGPLKGSNQYVDITPIEEMETSKEYIQFETNKTNMEFGCCRIRFRVRLVTKVPSVTVRTGTPQITINWKKPIPSVTVKGPDIVISDLPTLPSIESPIPTDGSTPNIGMDCNIENNEALLYIQNGESKAVDVWINWKEIIAGPIRIDANTMRQIGKTGYSDCKTANDNIFLTKAKFTN